MDYATALEGSLKLKEISYIHSEAYAAGELKHGTISLIEDGILTVAVVTQPDLYEKMISNIVEVRTRGGYIFTLTNKGNCVMEDTSDFGPAHVYNTLSASLAIVEPTTFTTPNTFTPMPRMYFSWEEEWIMQQL